MQIVLDIDLSAYDALGEVVKYGFTSPEEVPERVKDADVLIVNKVEINEQSIGNAEKFWIRIIWKNVASHGETLPDILQNPLPSTLSHYYSTC